MVSDEAIHLKPDSTAMIIIHGPGQTDQQLRAIGASPEDLSLQIWVIGMEPRLSRIAASTLNH